MSKRILDGNPWFSIWVRPRSTIREIVKTDPKYRFILLSAIYGFPMLLHMAQNLSLGEKYSTMAIIIGALVLATFVGMIGISIASVLIYWTGRWIGGDSGYYPVRAAVSWSNVPSIVNIMIWIILMATFGNTIFKEDFGMQSFQGTDQIVVFGAFFLELVLSIWSFVILVKGLGEVQGFSAWKGLLNVLIPFFLVAIIIWVLTWLFWVANGMPTG